jgi:hypothetical protein
MSRRPNSTAWNGVIPARRSASSATKPSEHTVEITIAARAIPAAPEP